MTIRYTKHGPSQSWSHEMLQENFMKFNAINPGSYKMTMESTQFSDIEGMRTDYIRATEQWKNVQRDSVICRCSDRVDGVHEVEGVDARPSSTVLIARQLEQFRTGLYHHHGVSRGHQPHETEAEEENVEGGLSKTGIKHFPLRLDVERDIAQPDAPQRKVGGHKSDGGQEEAL